MEVQPFLNMITDTGMREEGDGKMDEIMPHIRLSREQAADYVLLPRDPQRLDRIAECLEDVKELGL